MILWARAPLTKTVTLRRRMCPSTLLRPHRRSLRRGSDVSLSPTADNSDPPCHRRGVGQCRLGRRSRQFGRRHPTGPVNHEARSPWHEPRERGSLLPFDESGCAAEQYRVRTHARIRSRAVARRPRFRAAARKQRRRLTRDTRHAMSQAGRRELATHGTSGGTRVTRRKADRAGRGRGAEARERDDHAQR